MAMDAKDALDLLSPEVMEIIHSLAAAMENRPVADDMKALAIIAAFLIDSHKDRTKARDKMIEIIDCMLDIAEKKSAMDSVHKKFGNDYIRE